MTKSTGLFTNVRADYHESQLSFVNEGRPQQPDIMTEHQDVDHVVFGECGLIDITKDHDIIRAVIE